MSHLKVSFYIKILVSSLLAIIPVYILKELVLIGDISLITLIIYSIFFAIFATVYLLSLFILKVIEKEDVDVFVAVQRKLFRIIKLS